MRDYGKIVYRWMPEAVLTRADGTTLSGRGAVVRQKSQTGAFMPALAGETGLLCRPLYVFVGWLESAEPGDTLTQDGQTYRVLSAQEYGIAGTKVCLRVMLEKEATDSESL